MKRINLKGLSEVLSERELKNVLGGSGSGDCGGDNLWCICYWDDLVEEGLCGSNCLADCISYAERKYPLIPEWWGKFIGCYCS